MENKKEISLFKIVKKLMPMIFRYVPILTIIVFILGILHGTSHAVNTLVTQKFFDGINEAVRGNETSKGVIVLAIVLGVVIVVSQLLNGIHNYMWGYFGSKISGYFDRDINEKAGKIDPVIYEDTKLLDNINKARKGVIGSIRLMITFISIVAFYLPYFLFMSVYLWKLDKVLILSILFVFIPVFLTQFIRVKIFDKLEDEVAPIRREYEYYEKAICDREYFKETRILGGFKYFRGIYKDAMGILGDKTWKAEKKTGLLELSMKLLTLVGYFGVLYLLLRSLLKGNITIGAFSAVFASIDFMIAMMNEVIRSHIGRMTKDLGTVRNFIEFFDLPERYGEDIEVSADGGISLKNVSFSYPSAKEPSINGISLNIKPKEIIAVVGENGAGKSTLVRLITGLYLPTEGEVLFDGVDIRKISLKSLYKNTSGVFQKYQRYKMDLRDNVMISNLEGESEDLLNLSTEKADLDVKSESFPKGYDTMLSREFDGVDLSGGQWQRVAIARGFYKAHNMIVLDEPTAAIDPVEETRIYEKFASISKGKTSIIVTHRLGSAKIADRIIVMDKGMILEIGTHEELIARKGKYAEMYEAQAQWYVREEDEQIS